MRTKPAAVLALTALIPAAWAAVRMAPLFGPGAVLPLTAPVLLFAAALRTTGRWQWVRVVLVHLALVPLTFFLALIHPARIPLPGVVWGLVIWVVIPIAGHRLAAGARAGLLHGLVWVVGAWSAFGVMMAGDGAG